MAKSKKPTKSPGFAFWAGKNIIAGLIAYVFIAVYVFKEQPGYSWVYSMLGNNYKIIKQHPNVPDNEKMRSKLGLSYAYLEYIAKATPENAVILYPDKTALFPKDKKTEFRHDMYNKLWALRVLYPRKVVMSSEVGKTTYTDEITHIAIANGIGYDLLDYEPPQKPEHAVFPLRNSFIH